MGRRRLQAGPAQEEQRDPPAQRDVSGKESAGVCGIRMKDTATPVLSLEADGEGT